MIGRVGMLSCVLSVASFVASGGSAAQNKSSLARLEARRDLAQVRHWGCQYQNIELTKIASSSLDLIVIDPNLDGVTGRVADQSEVQAIQRKPDGQRRLVFAYLSVGAAEEYRPYWDPSWQVHPPGWLGPGDPNWPRSHAVRYWDTHWQSIVAHNLQRIVDAGFDGAFLDRVDAYHDWRTERSSAMNDMAGFIDWLGEAARARNPRFLLIGQNAEPLLANPIYRGAIDAVSKESLLTGLQGMETFNRGDQVGWSLNYLLPAHRAGLTILAIEYLSEPNNIAIVRYRLASMGFIPFIGVRLLDRLP